MPRVGQGHNLPSLPAPGEIPRHGPHRVNPAGGERISRSPGLAPEAPDTSPSSSPPAPRLRDGLRAGSHGSLVSQEPELGVNAFTGNH